MIDNKEKIRRVIEYLAVGHLHFDGGYPYDYVIDRGVVHVAGLSASKDRQATLFSSYRLNDLVTWYDSAVEYMVEYNEETKNQYGELLNPDEDLLSDEWLDDDWRISDDWTQAFSECDQIEEYVPVPDEALEEN
jgi:hypothetical protein